MAFICFICATSKTLGACEYGPRYLLPILALLTPGAASLLGAGTSSLRLLSAGALLAYGFLVNVVGAVQGTMYCTTDEFAFWGRVGGINHLPPKYFPLLRLTVYIAIGAAIAFAWRRLLARRFLCRVREAEARRQPVGERAAGT